MANNFSERVNGDNTYDVKYDGGKKKVARSVPKKLIRQRLNRKESKALTAEARALCSLFCVSRSRCAEAPRTWARAFLS